MSACTRLLLSFALGMAAFTAPPAHASLFETLYKFTGGADGAAPTENLVIKDGLLYGTTIAGGTIGVGSCGGPAPGCGTVFKLDPVTQTLTTLHTFSGGADGGNPMSGLVFDTTGELYGMTSMGGTTDCGGSGCGTVFRLDPTTRMLTTLHAFRGPDGASPSGSLLFRNGKFYGMTSFGGLGKDGGTVFELDPATHKLTTLYSFCAVQPQCADGKVSIGTSLVADTAGMLYGTTLEGGPRRGFGTVFQLNPITQKLITLRTFYGYDTGGYSPEGGLVSKNSKLFGTTSSGGIKRNGAVFKLYPATHHLETLHAFTGPPDGATPSADLTADPTTQSGVVYGTTAHGGRKLCFGLSASCGAVFKLKSATKKLTILHAFTGTDGAYPYGGVIFGTTGALYGSTIGGGLVGGLCANYNCGTVFKLVP